MDYYYDHYTENKIISFITKMDFFKEYIFSLDLPKIFTKEKIQNDIKNYSSDFAPLPYDGILQSVSGIISFSTEKLPFQKVCCLIFADICGLSESQLEQLSNKQLSLKKMEQLLIQMLKLKI